MLNAIKKLLKWALVASVIAAAVKWIKGKRSSTEDEQHPGLAEPWPPLDNSPAQDSSTSDKSD